MSGQRFTPFSVGQIPPNVARYADGPPYGRLDLVLAESPSDGDVVVDQASGESFRIRTGVDCGAGCRCAAEAEWVRS